MSRKAFSFAAIVTGLALMTAAGTTQQAAAQSGRELTHALALAEQQSALSQRIAKEIVLIALGYNPNENIRNLEFNHEQFNRILNGLRYGDVELALGPTSSPNVLEDLERVGEIWPLFDAAAQEAIRQGNISRGQVRLVADLSKPLLAAVDDLVHSIEGETRRTNVFSILTIMVEESGRAGMLSQMMAKEYFLIAFGHQPQRNREELRAAMAEFDGLITALTGGDLERSLLPPPTPQIRGQLLTVNRLWQEMRGPLTAAVEGREIDQAGISLVASVNLNLLQQLTTVEGMYEAL